MNPICNQFAKEDVRRGERIGQGSFWKVYKAKLMDDIPCAVKRLKVIDEDQGTLKKKVIEECRTWSGLNNPFIVKIHGIYYDGKGIALGVPSLILELLDKSLTSHLQSTARDRINLFPLQSKVSILLQVAKGLEYLHNEKCVVHGDLTPNNVLLKEESPGCFTAKLTDFGMSRVVEGCDAEMSTGYGAYVYMPPESHDAAQVKTTAMDIYSYGVLGVSTLTHKPPRPSYASRMDESGHLVGVTEFSRYSHLLLKLTEDEQQLVPVLEACIQYNPKDRTNAFILIERIAVISAQLKLAGNVKLGSATASSHSVHSHQIFNGCTFDKCDLNFRSEVPASLLQHSECSPISRKKDYNGTVEETVLTMVI
jgi:serine/threonine protein kinase